MLTTLLLLLACKDQPTEESPPNDDSSADDSATDDSGDDTGTEPAWTECPAGPTASGEGRPLTITGGALYCGTFNEGRTLDEEQSEKAQLRLPAGGLNLPTTAVTDQPLTLPACVRYAADTPGPVSQGAGTVTATFNTWGSETWFSYRIEQPLDDGTTLLVELLGLESGQDLRFDGSYLSVAGPVQGAWAICQGNCQSYQTLFDSCAFDNVDTQRNTIAYEGGELVLDLRIGESLASTEPGVFFQATGTHAGTAWSQTDYWSLVYNPEHHHFERDARVWLPSPIGEVCAIEALTFDPWGELPATRVRTLACDGSPLSEPTVTSDTFARIPSEG